MMRIFLFATAMVCSLSGCGTGYEEQRSVAEQFLAAAARGDSVEMALHAADEQPFDRVLAIRREDATMLHAAAKDLRVRFGERADSVAIVEFSFGHRSEREAIGFEFVLRDGRWWVSRVQLTDRI